MKKIILIITGAISVSLNARSQGCSDAGFCTAGAMNPVDNVSTNTKNSIGLSLTLGQGEEETSLTIFQLEYYRQVGRDGNLEVKLPYFIASGFLGNNAVIGDPIITYTHTLWGTGNMSIKGTAGTRISTGNANSLNDKGTSLPMPYQGNLGTTDLILGVSYSWKQYITAAIGIQQPVIQYNDNGYYPSASETRPFFPSRKLVRKGDILFRIDGQYQWKKLGIGAGPLFIYHLGADKVTQLITLGGDEIVVPGSDELTLNITARAFYKTDKWKADLSFGTPMIVRTTRPDGLTRAWVITPAFYYFF